MTILDVIAHHRLCTRHAEEWIPDENDRVCIFVESLVCDGELVEYVPAEQLRGAVEENERLRSAVDGLQRERDALLAVRREWEKEHARLTDQLRGAVDLLREARFYVDARAIGSVKAAKLLDRIDAALPPAPGQ